MPYALQVYSRNAATPMLRHLGRELRGGAASNLHKMLATAAEELTRTHVIGVARSRHATATRLGAKPTGFYSRAVDAIRSYADSTGAMVIIDHPGFARARKDVVLAPTGGRKFLTIPIHRQSYGKRAGEFSDLFVRKARNGKLYLVRRTPGGRIVALFLLQRSAKQAMDTSLLPTDKRYAKTAEATAVQMIRTQVAFAAIAAKQRGGKA